MTIQGYGNNLVNEFFKQANGNKNLEEWMWGAIKVMKELFPNADHYPMRGKGKYYIVVGVKDAAQSTGNGRRYFILFLNSQSAIVVACKAPFGDYASTPLKRKYTSSMGKVNQLKDWLEVMKKDSGVEIKGDRKNPSNYNGAEEGTAEDGDDQDDGLNQEKVESVSSRIIPMENKEPLNQILFGPPGTGKTYSTIDAALKVVDFNFYFENAKDRTALKARFDEYVKNQQICSVTFHQSFSYEDFVEGISAVILDGEAELKTGGLSYEIKDGIFLQICDQAKRNETLDQELGVREGAKIWKISIEESNSSGETRQYCFKHGEARIGWSGIGDIRTTDLSAPEYKLGTNAQSSISNFGCDIVKGDVLLCFGSLSQICAVGVVTGEYEYTPKVPVGVREDYIHKLPVNWLATDLKFDITALNQGRGLTLKTVYQLSRIKWPSLQDALIKEGVALGSQIKSVEKNKKPYVLIIDEINRGNISRIFGELITLIEPSKRIGADEELRVTLPYSKVPFGVPDNLYIIGTMNTSDRSLAGMDVALRRRFTFIDMPPKYDELNKIDNIEGVNVGELLKVINERIEVLLGRDYCIGHAYFMDLQKGASLNALAGIFRNKILPLLQEYFFEDWQRIRWVLNDHRKPKKDYQFITEHELAADTLFGAGVVDNSRKLYRVQDTAFESALSFVGIIDGSTLGLAKTAADEAAQ